jgi:phosphoribosylformylglycinamidine synthase I
MPEVHVLILRSAGTNCNRELAHAFQLAGAHADQVHINALLKNPAQLADYQILGLPGGFSYGDDIASGKILANQLTHHLKAALRQFIDDGKMILGVCNGFQVLVKSGLLPGPIPQLDPADSHPATLTYNTCGKFEDRWVRLRPVSRLCKWIPKDSPAGPPAILRMPIAHGEGRFVTRDPALLAALRANDQIALEYVDGSGSRAAAYPDLPNGSVEAIAGLCDITGRVLGLMPHPERIAEAVNHPLFTRGVGSPDGMLLFTTAIAHIRSGQAVAV